MPTPSFLYLAWDLSDALTCPLAGFDTSQNLRTYFINAIRHFDELKEKLVSARHSFSIRSWWSIFVASIKVSIFDIILCRCWSGKWLSRSHLISFSRNSRKCIAFFRGSIFPKLQLIGNLDQTKNLQYKIEIYLDYEFLERFRPRSSFGDSGSNK